MPTLRRCFGAMVPIVLMYIAIPAGALAQEAPHDAQWRRTSAGWERLEDWPTPVAGEVVAPQSPAVLHPALFALLVAGASIGALLLPTKCQTVYRGPERRQRHFRRKSDRLPATA